MILLCRYYFAVSTFTVRHATQGNIVGYHPGQCGHLRRLSAQLVVIVAGGGQSDVATFEEPDRSPESHKAECSWYE
jgi:hypothetical protein